MITADQLINALALPSAYAAGKPTGSNYVSVSGWLTWDKLAEIINKIEDENEAGDMK